MTRPVVLWQGSSPPSPAELRAIAQAWRSGQLQPGDAVACAIQNPSPERERERGRLELLRYQLRQAKEQSRKEVGELRRRRDLSRPRLAATVARFREKWRRWVNERVAELRERHRAVWQGRIAAAKLPVLRAQAELEAERGYQRDLRRIRSSRRKARGPKPVRRHPGRIARDESDEQVANNLPPELRTVWHAMKNRVRTRVPKKTRTEAFLEWAAENVAEVDAMQAEAFDPDELADELAAQEAAYYAEAG